MPVTTGGRPPFLGHELTSSEWGLLEEITRDFSGLAVTELAGTICELLEWRRPSGKLKARECYLFLLTLHSRGFLPWMRPPERHARGPHTITMDEASDPQPPMTGSLAQWAPVQLERIDQPAERKLFRQYIHRYHYLGYKVPYGAQVRYFVRSLQEPRPVLACLLFTSAAWKMAPRDSYVGWSAEVRAENLCRVVNNSRFLIFPWVRIPHLASHILARASRQIRVDWRELYAVDPVLMETLVDRDRYAGTCYRAANWVSVGMTQGRGRMDRTNTAQISRKEIFLYPLERRWQRQLCEKAAAASPANANPSTVEEERLPAAATSRSTIVPASVRRGMSPLAIHTTP